MEAEQEAFLDDVEFQNYLAKKQWVDKMAVPYRASNEIIVNVDGNFFIVVLRVRTLVDYLLYTALAAANLDADKTGLKIRQSLRSFSAYCHIIYC